MLICKGFFFNSFMKSPLLGGLNQDLKIFGIVTKLQTNKWSTPKDQESNWIY